MGREVASFGNQRNSEGIVMASSDDAMDAYTQGIWDAVMIINENEDTEYLWTDVYKALQIRKIINELEEV